MTIFDIIALWVGRLFILSLAMFLSFIMWEYITQRVVISHKNLMISRAYVLDNYKDFQKWLKERKKEGN